MKVSIRKNLLKKGNSYTVFVDYGIVNGSRKRTPLETFSTKKEAENYQAKVQSEINNNTFIAIPNITFSEAIDEWMEKYVANNCEPNTADSYKLNNEKYLKPCLGHIPFKTISSPQGIDIINNYYHYLRFELNETSNLSYSTVKHHKAQISGVFTYFLKTKRLNSNICLSTTIPRDTEEKNLDTVIDDLENIDNEIENFEDTDFLTPEQASVVLNLFMNTSMMLPVALAMFLGLRRSEVCGLLKSHVNKENNTLLIKSARVRCSKKEIYKQKNKNKTSTRLLYIPKIVIDIINLEEKRQKRNRLLLGKDYLDSKFLCVNDKGRAIPVDYVSHKFKDTIDNYIKNEREKNSDFTFPDITYHTLRHLNITALLENGAELVDVKDNAGHSNINTTMHYTHQYVQNKQQLADKIDEVFTPYIQIK